MGIQQPPFDQILQKLAIIPTTAASGVSPALYENATPLLPPKQFDSQFAPPLPQCSYDLRVVPPPSLGAVAIPENAFTSGAQLQMHPHNQQPPPIHSIAAANSLLENWATPKHPVAPFHGYFPLQLDRESPESTYSIDSPRHGEPIESLSHDVCFSEDGPEIEASSSPDVATPAPISESIAANASDGSATPTADPQKRKRKRTTALRSDSAPTEVVGLGVDACSLPNRIKKIPRSCSAQIELELYSNVSTVTTNTAANSPQSLPTGLATNDPIAQPQSLPYGLTDLDILVGVANLTNQALCAPVSVPHLTPPHVSIEQALVQKKANISQSAEFCHFSTIPNDVCNKIHTAAFLRREEPAPPPESTTTTSGRTRKQAKRACINCRHTNKKCDDERPCRRCVLAGTGFACVDVPKKTRVGGKRGPYRKTVGGTAFIIGASAEADAEAFGARIKKVVEEFNCIAHAAGGLEGLLE
ncbi:hypothetical protein HDU98_007058 [Podochytrium sp. JEL0797]|nr:hypothetical protein HDU98_007058 [Podochytrium sp. JEL0797]